jgi:hypothetical protein
MQMRLFASALFVGLALSAAFGGVAHAQFALPEETSETKWGGTAYGGGDVDSLGNYQFGIRANYRLVEIDPISRFSPELGIEVRKNYVMFKAGGRADSRELLRLSGFVGGGVLRIQDFTNSSGSSDASLSSDETWYYYFGAKLRLPGLGGVPLLGGILGGLPIEGVSLFAGQEINGLDDPNVDEANPEFTVDEWYTHSVQIGLMVGSASGFFE